MRRLTLAALLLALVATITAACRRDVSPPTPPPGTLSPALYERVLSDLVVARIDLLPDTAAWRARREEILARHRVTPDELRRFAEAYGPDDDVMTAIYARVGARVDSLSTAGALGGTAPTSRTEPSDSSR